jgi:peptide subunit release factor 1 (eRF1)
VIARWVAERERKLAAEILGAAGGGRAVSGLTDCLAAVNVGAADLLLIPEEGPVPGCACGRCGALTVTGSDCPDWGTAARPVADLLEEMAAQVLDDGGQVIVVRALPSVAARLRYPLPRGR